MTGIELAEIRREKGFSQQKLADLSGVSRVTIARFENGKCSPNLWTLQRLAEALDVPIDRIVGKENA